MTVSYNLVFQLFLSCNLVSIFSLVLTVSKVTHLTKLLHLSQSILGLIVTLHRLIYCQILTDMAVSPSRSLPPSSQRRTAHIPTISTAHQAPAPSSSDLLQNRLRQLLICDSAEELRVDQVKIRAALNTQCRLTSRVEQMAPLSPPAEYSSQRCHKSLPDLHCRGSGGEPSSNKSSNKSLSNRDSGGSSGHYTQRSEPAPPPRQVS